MTKGNLYDERGFTLLELAIVMAIAVMLVGFASGPAKSMSAERKVQQAGDDAILAIRWTRAMAIAQRRELRLCAKQLSNECTPFSADSSAWIVRNEEPPQATIREFKIQRGIRVIGPTSRQGIVFRADGFSLGSNLTLKICDSEGNWRQSVVLNNGGRVRSETLTVAGPC